MIISGGLLFFIFVLGEPIIDVIVVLYDPYVIYRWDFRLNSSMNTKEWNLPAEMKFQPLDNKMPRWYSTSHYQALRHFIIIHG